MLNPMKKAGSFAEFLYDVKALGKIVLVEAFKHTFIADVTGQEGERGYIVKGKEKTWTVGADCLTKASVLDGLPIEGVNGKVKVSVKGKDTVTMSEEAFERHPLFGAIVSAHARQREYKKTKESE
jgi:hypothetical protein